MTPGKIHKLFFAMQPISILIKKGHRLRIAIAGADEDTFARIPGNGEVEISILRDKYHPSCIDLPVIRTKKDKY
jgi:predicted acyl esterase